MNSARLADRMATRSPRSNRRAASAAGDAVRHAVEFRKGDFAPALCVAEIDDRELLRIAVAADEIAEIDERGHGISAFHLPLQGPCRGRSAAKRPGGGDSRAANEAPKVRHRCHPTPDHLRWQRAPFCPPPSGEGEDDCPFSDRMSGANRSGVDICRNKPIIILRSGPRNPARRRAFGGDLNLAPGNDPSGHRAPNVRASMVWQRAPNVLSLPSTCTDVHSGEFPVTRQQFPVFAGTGNSCLTS